MLIMQPSLFVARTICLPKPKATEYIAWNISGIPKDDLGNVRESDDGPPVR